MKLLGHPFTCITPDIEENIIEGESPAEHVMRLSERKAVAVGQTVDHAFIIGSDTVVVIDGEILGKPDSGKEALEMIMRLQGRSHRVFTGFSIYNTENKRKLVDYETSEVMMRGISLDTAKKYVDTKEPLDKAGSYGIQGYGSVLIKSVNGCFFNVMGLPLSKLMDALYIFSDNVYGYFGIKGNEL